MQNPIEDPTLTNPPSAPDPDRHARKCAICHHPQRAEIDEDYLHWRRPSEITRCYQLGHRCAIYRHADATGLATRRRGNVFHVLDSIIEHSETVKPSANDVLKAIRLYAQMTGRWQEPKRTYVITHRDASGEATTTEFTAHRPGLGILSPFPAHPCDPESPNRDTPELENGSTR